MRVTTRQTVGHQSSSWLDVHVLMLLRVMRNVNQWQPSIAHIVISKANESTVGVFRPISRRNSQWFSLLRESESVIIRIIIVYSNDIVKTFQFHVPRCCLPSANKLSDSQAKVEKLNQSPKCGYYYSYWFIPVLLLQTSTIWFSIDLMQWSQKKMIKLWFLQLWFSRDYDSIYHSNFWFSLGHRQSYQTAQD